MLGQGISSGNGMIRAAKGAMLLVLGFTRAQRDLFSNIIATHGWLAFVVPRPEPQGCGMGWGS